MRVLITGGAGFIGSHCVDRFVHEGVDVVVLDNLNPQVHKGKASEVPIHIFDHIRKGRVRFIKGDVRNRQDVQRALEGVDTVIHLAAAVGVGQSMYKPFHYMDVNVAGQAVIMEEMAKNPSRWRRFIVASSMSVYGEGQYRCAQHGLVAPPRRSEEQLKARDFELYCPYCSRVLEPVQTPEEKPLQPTSVYAISKRTQEELALCFGSAYGISTVALRFFNVYGSRQSLSNPYTGVLAIFFSRLKNGKPPLIFEDGAQSRDFIHVSDVAEAVWRAAIVERHICDTYNVCTGKGTSIREVADILCRRIGSVVRPQCTGQYRSGDIRHCIGDPQKAERELGFSARYSFEEGLEEFLMWAREQHAEDLVEVSLRELQQRRLIV